jgi:hypothetical protein
MWTPFLDGYAFGWNILPPAAGVYGGHPRMVHSGGIQGFASTLMRLPDVHVATIILSNNESIDPTVIGRAIAAIYFGQPYPIPGR